MTTENDVVQISALIVGALIAFAGIAIGWWAARQK